MSRHLYLIGIGGVGMVWIADYALQHGWKVSGSDVSESDTVQRLQRAGATVHLGSDPQLIPEDVTEAIITAAITPGSPSFAEYEELLKRNIPISKRAQWVGKLTKTKRTIAICGAHGKTTTTAMVGWILNEAGLDPTVFVGGSVGNWEGTKIGKGEYLVLEADEYDRSFHQFYPEIAVVLNIDLDHTDYYTGGIGEIEQSYRRFLRNLPHKQGIVVAYGRDPRIRKVSKGFAYRYRWYDEEHLWPGVQVPQPGMHYQLNATAAARVAHELGIPQATIRRALASFPGAGRRYEYLGTWNTVQLFDDYGHHPTEVAATLRGLRERYPSERICLVYQAHQKARTQALLKEFGQCFAVGNLQRLIIAPIYWVAGRETDIPVTNQTIRDEVSKHDYARTEVTAPETNEQLEQEVIKETELGGIMMVMGAGDIRRKVDAWRK